MITDFKGFGPAHLLSLFAAAVIGTLFLAAALKTQSDKRRRAVRIVLALVLIAVRGARYVLDACFGVFELKDLLSLQLCHIDLILLAICLIKPNRALFNICFLIGIPAALSVALFPGSQHQAPGIPRAVLFIMSHALLVIGALYLAIVERLKPSLKMAGLIAAAGTVCLIPVYFINSFFGTNFLYIMEAPKGTVLVLLQRLFGWPGYVFALAALAYALMLVMLGLGRLLAVLAERSTRSARQAESA